MTKKNNLKSRSLLIIFTRNPKLGKVKTRLAKVAGDRAALDIYNFLLQHTVSITKELEVDKVVYYSEEIPEQDIWDEKHFQKKLQQGEDLGVRMGNAFREGFSNGYKKIVIIGSDMYDMTSEDLETAFAELDNHEFVIGPAEDGGYYLLGMTRLLPKIFQNKKWGTSTVLSDTLANLQNKKFLLLGERNDVDLYEDIKDQPDFQQFLQHLKI